eukprot:NODE_43_length_33755_cov_1.178542.p13 type:complete len:310 gc:universal NODE_43_length_33755_cov_1.178542:2923-3852(+)
MNLRILSATASFLGALILLFYLFCIVGGYNADGLRESYFIQIQRDFSAMMNPMMGGMGGMGMNPMMGGMGMSPMMGGMGGMGMNPMMGGMMTPSYKITMALRNWCIYQYKIGNGMPTPLWGDFGSLPTYEIKIEDESVIQCVHPSVAMNDERILIAITSVIGLQSPMMYAGYGYGDSFFFDRASTLYYGLEALYYILLTMALICTVLSGLSIAMKNAKIPMISAICSCCLLIPGIIAFSIWTFIFARLQAYAQFGNMWENDVYVQVGTSYVLTILAVVFSFILVSLSGLIFARERKSHQIVTQKITVTA